MIISLGVTATSFLFINGVAFLIPSLQARRGIPLTEAGLLASMPSWGMVVTLVLWGYFSLGGGALGTGRFSLARTGRSSAATIRSVPSIA